jgi:anti-anti-sigma regulatory factor
VLRISAEPTESVVTMRLEGKVVGPWVDECHRAWQAIRVELGLKKLRLDVRGVTFMDSRGITLLREIRKLSGAEVLADCPLTKYFAERIMQEVETEGNEGV